MTVPVAAMQLEEVVVTAQKREQSANDVGIAIVRLPVSKSGSWAFSAPTILPCTPGLTVNETAATGVPLCTIRGVGAGLFDRSVLNCRHLF